MPKVTYSNKFQLIGGLHVWNNHQINIIQLRQIAQLHQHQLFQKPGTRYDIALIKTTKPFILTNYVQPIQLVEKGFEPKGVWMKFEVLQPKLKT